jgi:hypothetical protein
LTEILTSGSGSAVTRLENNSKDVDSIENTFVEKITKQWKGTVSGEVGIKMLSFWRQCNSSFLKFGNVKGA